MLEREMWGRCQEYPKAKALASYPANQLDSRIPSRSSTPGRVPTSPYAPKRSTTGTDNAIFRTIDEQSVGSVGNEWLLQGAFRLMTRPALLRLTFGNVCHADVQSVSAGSARALQVLCSSHMNHFNIRICSTHRPPRGSSVRPLGAVLQN